jgi:hypothetical protein
MRKVALLIGLIWTSPVSAQELLANGNFETGTYAGWVTATQTGSGGALFIEVPGSTTPSGQTTAANAGGGSFYSVTDAEGPGAYSLTQGFAVPVGTTALTFSFDMFANNYAEQTYVSPTAGLDFSTPSLNQHARVDLLAAGADPFSTAAGDVIHNFYLGADPGPNPNPYTPYSFDIFSFIAPGQSYQIRFAEVDNVNFFNLGVDNVSISTAAAGAVPEPATWSLMLMGFGAIGFSLRRSRRSLQPITA